MLRHGELQCRRRCETMDIRPQSRAAPPLYKLWPDGIFLFANCRDGLLWFISDTARIPAFRPHCRRSLRFSERIAKHVWAIPSVSKLDRRSSWTRFRRRKIQEQLIISFLMIQDMNTNRQLIEQFLQFINTGDATIGKPIISDDVIFYAPTSPEPMKGFEGGCRNRIWSSQELLTQRRTC